MTTTSYAERARQFRASAKVRATSGNEINEVNEINIRTLPVVDSQESQRTCAVSAKSAVSPEQVYAPLNDVIAADVATKHPRDVIAARLERLAARAALPEATPLDRVVAADWRRILAAKGTDAKADAT